MEEVGDPISVSVVEAADPPSALAGQEVARTGWVARRAARGLVVGVQDQGRWERLAMGWGGRRGGRRVARGPRFDGGERRARAIIDLDRVLVAGRRWAVGLGEFSVFLGICVALSIQVGGNGCTLTRCWCRCTGETRISLSDNVLLVEDAEVTGVSSSVAHTVVTSSFHSVR